jgi:hypothetical protein
MTVATSPVQTAMEAPKHGLPVTIITGFLGSGKTTLLNHILTNQQGLKTAVLVNEFGEIGIDNELIVKTDEDGTLVELSNGCICCTINEDLMNAVYKVLEREDKVDYLVVETTGLADPLPVALTFLGSELRDMTRLDSICSTAKRRRARSPTATSFCSTSRTWFRRTPWTSWSCGFAISKMAHASSAPPRAMCRCPCC